MGKKITQFEEFKKEEEQYFFSQWSTPKLKEFLGNYENEKQGMTFEKFAEKQNVWHRCESYPEGAVIDPAKYTKLLNKEDALQTLQARRERAQKLNSLQQVFEHYKQPEPIKSQELLEEEKELDKVITKQEAEDWFNNLV